MSGYSRRYLTIKMVQEEEEEEEEEEETQVGKF
jgi:hypothetical protein